MKAKQIDFNIDNIASQKGRIAIVTGANAGLGYETALVLAQKEMKVTMACRSEARANKAKAAIVAKVPNADLEVMLVDLSSLKSVREFAKTYLAKYDRLDILINNAGVMFPPYEKTEDGFELQMAANYFGHFLLTGLLLGILEKTPHSRVVSLSSKAHESGRIQLTDIHWEKQYNKRWAYSQSKLACLMYAYELQRRLSTASSQVISVAAHPGVSATELGKHIPRLLYYALRYTIAPFIIHAPKKGALPTLLAALGSDVKGGDYYGPVGFNEMKGPPGYASSTSLSKDPVIAQKLWEVSEQLTGIKYL